MDIPAVYSNLFPPVSCANVGAVTFGRMRIKQYSALLFKPDGDGERGSFQQL